MIIINAVQHKSRYIKLRVSVYIYRSQSDYSYAVQYIHGILPGKQASIIKLSSKARKLEVSICLYCLQYSKIEVHFCSWCWQSLSPSHPPTLSLHTLSVCTHWIPLPTPPSWQSLATGLYMKADCSTVEQGMIP